MPASGKSLLYDVNELCAAKVEDPRAKLVSVRCATRPVEGIGGARRDRTDDLLLAKQALSQLSYGPVKASAASPAKADGGPG